MRPRFSFDDVVLDLGAFRLTRGGREVHLEPKVLELLGYLVQHRGRLVEKAELQAAVWSDAAVSESALTRAVAQLRKALDDDAREARYVETVPTRGYRFRSDVRVQEAQAGRVGTSSQDDDPPSESRTARRPLAGRRLAAAALALVLALGGLYATRAERSRAAVRPAMRELHRTLVSTSRGFNGYPSFSPDGGTLAFSSDRSGRLELYVRLLAPGARETPVTSDGQDNVQPAWSPDGRYIAYHSMRRGGLWLVPALGGTPRQLTTFGSAPAWSPDGRRIAFSSLGLASLDGMTQPTATLFVLDVARSAADPRPLTTAGAPPSGHGPPAFSPDGSRVYFAADGVWVVDSIGASAPRQVVRGSAMEVAPSPDGRFLLWTGWERGNWHVWSAALDHAGEKVGEASELLNTGDMAARHLSMARDGRLACTLASIVSELALVPLSRDGGPAAAPVEPWPGNTGRKVQLHFAPDGRTLAFARVQPGQRLEVFGLDLETKAVRPLPSEAELGQIGGWFPQGDALLVTSRGGPSKALLRAPLSGGRWERLANADGMAWARLLPSGREVVFQSTVGGILNVHRSRLDGRDERALSDDAEGVGWPVPSPDGRALAVEMFRGNDTQLGLLPADGGVARALTRLPGQHWVHDWSRDGRRALFAARRDGLWNVYWMDVETGEERRLTDHGRVREAVRTPAWSPAGDRVAYERIETTGAVWLVELRGAAPPESLAARQD
jgi:Tol biopolymer transport system component/DNA-binding winged helix-turn-helix (wHTH) protein